MSDNNRQDEIIRLQYELLRQKSERDLRNVASDLWGSSDNDQTPEMTLGDEKKNEADSDPKKSSVDTLISSILSTSLSLGNTLNERLSSLTDKIRGTDDEDDSEDEDDCPFGPAMQTDTPSIDAINKIIEDLKKNMDTDFFSSTPKEKETSETPSLHYFGSSDDEEEKEEEEAPKEDIATLKAELDGYIGLEAVKEEVRGLINLATVYQMRRKHGLPTADLSLHLVFSGNPGTGKTMIARFMARVYHSLGILSADTLIETDRAGLVAGYVGQTALKTKKVLETALGGVLFIDEAYTLTAHDEDNFGQEAVDTVLKYMEDHRDDIVVIVAGYTEPMEKFINSNPGLSSRFNKYIHFADYTAEEMRAIFDLQCKKHEYNLTEETTAELDEYFRMVAEAAGEFGNARGVRNVFEKVLAAQANRLGTLPDVTKEDLILLTKEDIRLAVYGKEPAEK